jgi:hypothetical protein
MTEAAEDIDVSELEEIERIAVELATLAGAEIQAALGSMIAVRYKGESPEKTLWRDPVSEIDQRVETKACSEISGPNNKSESAATRDALAHQRSIDAAIRSRRRPRLYCSKGPRRDCMYRTLFPIHRRHRLGQKRGLITNPPQTR